MAVDILGIELTPVSCLIMCPKTFEENICIKSVTHFYSTMRRTCLNEKQV